ncbi:MAG: coagulation factor 5/8 type domain-containing protein, partial [Capsulimonadaceae bacterium]
VCGMAGRASARSHLEEDRRTGCPDVDGVDVSGILFDAGTTSSPILLQVGPRGSSASHAADPISLHDDFVRVGGDIAGQAAEGFEINSNNVIGDDFWLWRADHGNTGTVGWTINTGNNGLVVNGANDTMYGLAVEHWQQYQTLWNGNGGSVYFYQSEAPYDPPSQSAWMAGSEDGYSSYEVSSGVTSHQAYGVGVYAVFTDTSIVLNNAIECPDTAGVTFTDMVTIGISGTINYIINGTGASVNSGNFEATLDQYP